jgi:hypothetical protein
MGMEVFQSRRVGATTLVEPTMVREADIKSTRHRDPQIAREDLPKARLVRLPRKKNVGRFHQADRAICRG